ncbi:Mur ligase [Halobaculum sp. D14]|uniref:Mur ligase n=1 Tax=Halobaculum sp. D14 TaxID=3421642 RepID=UPI003EBC8C58
MNEQGMFEVVRSEEGWFWRLSDSEVCLAVGADRYESSRVARQHIDRVRDAAAELESLDTDEFEYVESPSDDDRPTLRVRGDESSDIFEWVLEDDDETLAVPSFTYTERANAREAMRRFRHLATGAIPVYLVGAETDVEFNPFEVGMSTVRGALSLLDRGRQHRQFLDNIDTRIVVSGIRGKSSTVKRLDDVFRRRGYDTLTKITGNHPLLIRNGDVIPIERTGPYTTLYENINVLREFGPQLESYTPEDVGIFENQGITEYTTRLINERFIKPHVVVIANVRQDHQDTLGKTVRDLARAFARTIPPGTKVVNGEQNPVLAEYMREEIEQQGGEMRQVTIPDDQQGRIGAETVYAVNDVLRWLDMEPVPEEQLNAYLDAIQPRWIQLPGGRIFNGAEINDIESTEAIRQSLAGDDHVLPFVYLRADRRSRTASFAKYLNTLAERNLIERARAGGAFTGVFASNVDVPVIQHDRDEDAGAVLEDMLEEGYPVLTMGNTVDDFMRDLEDEIETRAKKAAVEATD